MDQDQIINTVAGGGAIAILTWLTTKGVDALLRLRKDSREAKAAERAAEIIEEDRDWMRTTAGYEATIKRLDAQDASNQLRMKEMETQYQTRIKDMEAHIRGLESKLEVEFSLRMKCIEVQGELRARIVQLEKGQT